MSLLGAADTQILLVKSGAEVGRIILTPTEFRSLDNLYLVISLSIYNQKWNN